MRLLPQSGRGFQVGRLKLSFPGRLVLVKHVLASMPIHIAMVLPLPKSVCNMIESCMKNFLWSASKSERRANFVSWGKVCLPKQEGDLDIRRAHERNAACFIKMGWKALSSASLWTKWFSFRYLRKGFSIPILSNSWVLVFGKRSNSQLPFCNGALNGVLVMVVL